MYLVNEDDDIGIVLELFHQHLQSFFKLSAILCASHDTCHVERDNPFSVEHGRRFPVGNQLCQSFYDRTLAYAGFSDQDGIVLFPSPQNLDYSLYLVLTAYYGIEFAVERSLCQVVSEVVEHGCLTIHGFLGLCRCGLLPVFAIVFLLLDVVLLVLVGQ